MSATVLIFCIAGAFVAYTIGHALIMRATEGVRLELAGVGKSLLTRPDVSEAHKELVSDMLEDVFSWKFMAFATFYFPIAMFTRRKIEWSEEDRQFMCDEEVDRFFDLHKKAAAAASPFWTFIFVIVAAVTIVVLIAFVGFSMLNQTWVDTVKHVSPHVHYNKLMHDNGKAA